MKEDWTEKEINFLKENYQKFGVKYCMNVLGLRSSQVRSKASHLKLSKKNINKWEIEEINFLNDYYLSHGAKYCSEKLNKTIKQIKWQAIHSRIKIPRDCKKWLSSEIQFLRDNYKNMGAKYCSDYLNRTINATRTRAVELNILRRIHGQEEPGIKTCSVCKLKKEFNKFSSMKHGRLKLSSDCKSCVYKRTKIWKEKNRKQITTRQRERERLKRKNPTYRLILNARARTRLAFRGIGKRKPQKTFELIGCSPQEYIEYIKSKLLPGMTIENYGVYTWHIDHIKPISSFDLSDPEQYKICFHYTNLQPLWATTTVARKFGDYKNIGNCNKRERII